MGNKATQGLNTKASKAHTIQQRKGHSEQYINE